MKAIRVVPCIFFLFLLLFSISAQGAVLRQNAVLGGAYDELLPGIVKGRPFVISGKTRWEYDDNIYSDEVGEVSSWKFLLEPKVDYHKITAASYFGAWYQLSYRWFENRPEDEEDLSHDFGASFNYYLSNSFEIRLRDIYRDREDQLTYDEGIEQEELTTTETAEPVVGQVDVDESFQRNDFSGSLIYTVSERLRLIGSGTHLWLDYEDETRSISNDRTEYSLGIRGEYDWKVDTSLSLGYVYSDVDYDQDIVKVDSTTNQYYVGINRRFSHMLTGSLNAGWQDRTFASYSYTITDENGEEIEVIVDERDQSSPYINLNISSPLSESLVTTMGYKYTISETDESMFLSQEVQRFYLSLTNKFTPRFSVRFNGIMEFGDFSVDESRTEAVTGDYSEDTVQFAIVFRYMIKQGWHAETGWRYIDVDSDFPNNTYERNRTFIGLNAIF